MIVFPRDHPAGKEQRERMRERLLPTHEREELVRQFGELIRPMLTELLDATAEELLVSYEQAWRAAFATLKEDENGVLKTREEAAELLGCSVSTIQRLEKTGELPKARRYGHRTVRHLLSDIGAFIQTLDRKPKG